MIVRDWNVYEYELDFVTPVTVKGKRLEKRKGLILQFLSEQGSEGFGEVAPLPGVSPESFDDALSQITALRQNLKTFEIPEDVEKLEGGLTKWLGPYQLHSSVQFGVEAGILGLLANSRSIPLYQLLGDNYHDEVRINGLILGKTKHEAVQNAAELIENHFTTLKLKVSPDVKKEIDRVIAVSEVICGRALLHVDANQNWSLNDAVLFGHEVGLATVDYIEEPFVDFHQATDFFMKTTIPVAIDESLMSTTIRDVKSVEGIEHVVFKPTVTGGVESTWTMKQEANAAGLNTVLSSSFESGVGILTIAQMAANYKRDASAGLDTLKFLKQDLLKKPLKISGGKLNIKDRVVESADIRFDLLKKITS